MIKVNQSRCFFIVHKTQFIFYSKKDIMVSKDSLYKENL